MSLMELANAYAAENASATHAAINYGRDSALYKKCSIAMLEARAAVVEAVEKLERDSARLDWLEKDGDSHVFFIADTWYSRTAYGQPYRKCLNLRDALDKSMEATNGQGN